MRALIGKDGVYRHLPWIFIILARDGKSKTDYK